MRELVTARPIHVAQEREWDLDERRRESVTVAHRGSRTRVSTGTALGNLHERDLSPAYVELCVWMRADTTYKQYPRNVFKHRLRIGHVGVRHHLKRFGMVSTDCCSCGAVETIDHFLLSCTNYSLSRRKLRSALGTINVEFSLKNVLGGGDFTPLKQICILKCVAEFLFSIGRVMELWLTTNNSD